MNRRSFLSIGVASGSLFAGCLGTSPDEEESGTGTTESKTYEECPLDILGIGSLPEPAEIEVLTALENGSYETDEELVLETVMDTDSSVLRYDEEYYRYYEPIVETRNDTTVLELDETNPDTNETLQLVNRTDKTQATTLRMRLEDETVFTDEFKLEADETVTVSDEDVDFRYGRYRVEVESVTVSTEITWEIDEFGSGYFLEVTEDGASISGPEDSVDPMLCRWDSDGNLEHR